MTDTQPIPNVDDLPLEGLVDVLRPADNANFEARAVMFADWHKQFSNGLMPTQGIDPDSLGVSPHDMDAGMVAISIASVSEASRDTKLTAHDSFLYGTRDETVFGSMSAAGMAFLQDKRPNPNPAFREMDGLDNEQDGHTMQRKHAAVALREILNPSGIKRFKAYLADSARTVVDEVIEQGSFDAAELATELPRKTIGDMLDIPAEKQAWVSDLGQNSLMFQDPVIAERKADQADGAFNLMLYFADKATKQTNPDLVAEEFTGFYTKLLQYNKVADGDKKFSDTEIANMMLMLAAAGNETSRNAIAIGIYALANHPDQMAELAELETGTDEYESKWTNAVEEILRWGSPVIGFARRAIEPTDINGVAVADGMPVMLMYAAANRDPRVFENPDEFDINRPNAKDHVAFGGAGRHYCMGATVAKLQIKAVLQEVVARMPDMEVAGDLELAQSSYVTSVRSLPIRFTPTQSAA